MKVALLLMLTDGASKDYHYGQKNNWRRTVHNRIKDRLQVPVKQANVLYLSGQNDLDRPEFLRRGFRGDNLISVERDRDAVYKIRAKGTLCMSGTLSEVVRNVRGLEFHVVLADFCGGFTDESMHLLFAIIHNPCFGPSVCALNLLRGRDPSSNEYRADVGTRHRGVIAYRFYFDALLAYWSEAVGEDAAKELRPRMKAHHKEIFQPWGDSYKSGPLYYDSIVFINWGLDGFRRINNLSIKQMMQEKAEEVASRSDDIAFKQWLPGYYSNEAESLLIRNPIKGSDVEITNPQLARQFAAIKAHRTRRLIATS